MLRETCRDRTEGVEPLEKLAAYALEAARRDFGIGDVAHEDSDYFEDTALDCWVENGGLDYAKASYVIAIRTGIGISNHSGLSEFLGSTG